ncbi:Reticulocyte-binding protein 2 homolog a [Durusdinium trenchii]|uniref:Reticulocyte-binding protein 2 homolog a n=1 Tax=Durusdinium trenchii TaxID=1381693 RepID=A0ABP0HM88_9DINO
MGEIDMSVFSKMAELLARPLSPTALEKEEALAKNGKRIPKAKADRKVARPKESKAAASQAEAFAADPFGDKGILSAVSELSDLQQEWKEKMKHPSFRKAGPPRMKRPPPQAVLDEQERRHKMEEIDTLELQLKEAKNVAAAARRAAQAAEQLAEAAAKEAESGSEDGQTSQHVSEKKEEVDLQHQAEARVQARRRQEAKERRDRQRKEAEEKRLKEAEADAKAKELERQTKERIQERRRSERARDRQLQEEMERESELKEQRSQQAAEELQQQALKRLADKEQVERHLADELAKMEAEAKRQQAQENQARAEELRQKTRRRMQQYTRQQRDQWMAQEEARRRKMEEEAQAADDKIMQAIQSQERAKARAAEFKHREKSVEKARAMLEEEQQIRQQELAEVAHMERQRKRHWRAELARGATPLRSEVSSSRASSHPPLRPAPVRPVYESFGGRSAESSRASTPKCPIWSIVDGDESRPPPRPLPRPTPHEQKKVPLQRLTRAVSQPPRPSKPGSGACSGASTPEHWDEPSHFVEEVTAYPENPRCVQETQADDASTPSSVGPGAPKSPKPWKQKAIQVNSAAHYLDALKAARGVAKAKTRPTPGSKGYAEQLRLRAEDVEAKQREEEDVRMERGYAALQRVQQRARQAASPTSSSRLSG